MGFLLCFRNRVPLLCLHLCDRVQGQVLLLVFVGSFVNFPLEHQLSAGSAKEILEFLFGDEITDAQKQKALDAAVAEDLNRGENGYSFQGQQTTNHTSDMESV